MYLLGNAWKSIIRNKGRNILLMIIALVIAVAACISLSIREAAESAKDETLSNLSVTAQISYDRSGAMADMSQQSDTSDGTPPDRSKFDFSSMEAAGLTLEDYMQYTSLLTDEDSYYYTATATMNGVGDILPYGETEDTDTEETTSQPTADNNRAGKMEMMAASYGDFILEAASSYDAMLSKFGEDGTYVITEGEMFDESSDDMEVVISDELALYNNLSVGDSLELENKDYEGETYQFVIVGIYTNSASDTEGGGFSVVDSANYIYLSTASLENVMASSEENETSAAITDSISFTYVFPDVEAYEAFKAAAEDMGLEDNYQVTSADLSAFESSLTPLNTLSTMAGWFFWIVLLIGGIILVVLNIFNLRERKYEIGVLTAIGMKKSKVALQFLCELFLITFTAIFIGAGIGAVASVPVTNTLLVQQIEEAEESSNQVAGNFGMSEDTAAEHGFNKGMNRNTENISYVESVSSATDLTVILQLIAVGMVLTILSGLVAMVSILRYEPLQILSSRS